MLRELLQQITHDEVVATHAPRIEEARTQFGHTIAVLSADQEYLAYNCVMHALGIEFDPVYLGLRAHCPENVHASTDFLQFLCDEGDLVELEDCVPGCLVVYSHEGQFRHIGRAVEDGRVRSKWGIGHLYEHELLEVPGSYGTDIRFLEPIDRETVLSAFYEYAQTNGVEFPDGEG